jgi:isoleucyl-tRNA synthetase
VSDAPHARYRELTADDTPDALENALLETWDAEGLFDPSFTPKPEQKSFVFYEGPPTANGKPGIHHVFARTLKDLIPRHRAMKGFHITRKAGWDTHGLPVEIEVEKALGISGKRDIEAIGVAEFNRRCRESVFTYRGDWEKLSKRMAYWLDYERPYVTYTNDYVESVWWALATMHAKGLLVQGHKILPYCPRCETALSSHEVAQGYKDVEDPSTYIGARRAPGSRVHRAAEEVGRRVHRHPRRIARGGGAGTRLGRSLGVGARTARGRSGGHALRASARLGRLPRRYESRSHRW